MVDGRIVFSKKQAGRFPLEGEVEDRIEKILAGGAADPAATPDTTSANRGVFGRIASKLRR